MTSMFHNFKRVGNNHDLISRVGKADQTVSQYIIKELEGSGGGSVVGRQLTR